MGIFQPEGSGCVAAKAAKGNELLSLGHSNLHQSPEIWVLEQHSFFMFFHVFSLLQEKPDDGDDGFPFHPLGSKIMYLY